MAMISNEGSFFGRTSAAFCRMTLNYESLLNTTRAAYSYVDCLYNAPSYIPEPLRNFAWQLHVYIPALVPASTQFLLPVVVTLKYGRDFLTGIELPLRIMKLADKKAWDPERTQRAKLASMMIQIPQKMIESFLLIPGKTFKIYDLAAFCTKFGAWTSTTFLTVTFIGTVKDICVLSAALLSAFSCFQDISRDSSLLKRKKVRLQGLEELKANISDVAVFKQKLEAFNSQATLEQRRDLQKKPFKTLDQLKERLQGLKGQVVEKQGIVDAAGAAATAKMKENLKKAEALYTSATERYVRRYFLEMDGNPEIIRNNEGDHIDFPLRNLSPDIPVEAKELIAKVSCVNPTREERLNKLISYKLGKCQGQTQITSILIEKATRAIWFDLSKALIVTCALASLGTGIWVSSLIIGTTGLIRTWYTANNDERQIKLPNAKDFFAITA